MISNASCIHMSYKFIQKVCCYDKLWYVHATLISELLLSIINKKYSYLHNNNLLHITFFLSF
jgi:hypothetical protein